MGINSDTLKSATQPDLKTKIIERLNHHLPPPGEMDPAGVEAFTSYRDKLASALSEACSEIISTKVVEHINEFLVITGATVKIPAGAVITAVAGQATGTANPQPISCEINFNDDAARLE